MYPFVCGGSRELVYKHKNKQHREGINYSKSFVALFLSFSSMESDFFRMKKVTIIAMKGYPFTRKTEFAQTIAAFLECPILSTEDALSCLQPPLSPEQEYEALSIVCKMAYRLIHTGISKTVVIDSPLSSRYHLKQLTSMFNRLSMTEVRVLIIECKPTDNYSWKMKFEKHSSNVNEWYKAKNWEDVEKAIQDNPDYHFDWFIEGNMYLLKLVMDPLVDCQIGTQKNAMGLFVEAVKYMLIRERGDFDCYNPDIVFFHELLQQSEYPITPKDKNHCRMHGHDIVPGSRVVEHEEATMNCKACKKQISRSHHDANAYCCCRNCNLALHMECAEAFNDDQEARSSMSREFKVCSRCRESRNELGCSICSFKGHLRLRLFPTVIKHFDVEEHFLTIILMRGANYCVCVACGETDGMIQYLCKDCGVAYCYECIKLPRRVEDEHGGHHHNLSLKFKSEEAVDYICLECLEFRDPKLWFYSCEDCPGYELHPHCVRRIQQLHPIFKQRQERGLDYIKDT